MTASKQCALGGASARGWVKYEVGNFALDVAWEALPSEVLTLFGPSGAGKTTLLRAIAGLIEPQEGRIEIGGTVVFDSSAGIRVPPHRRRVGLLTQGYHLFPHLSVAENIGYGFPTWTPLHDGPASRSWWQHSS